MFHAHNDPTDLIRNVKHEEAAALVPFHLASHEDEGNLNPLPPCSWICFVLPVVMSSDVCWYRLCDISWKELSSSAKTVRTSLCLEMSSLLKL